MCGDRAEPGDWQEGEAGLLHGGGNREEEDGSRRELGSLENSIFVEIWA